MTNPHIEIAVGGGDWPDEAALQTLAERAVAAAVAVLPASGAGTGESARRRSFDAQEVSILFTDDTAVRALNARWRRIDKPTNVLSFPQSADGPLLGDIALAAETVRKEAALAQKPLEDHIAHLIVHGFYHLLGYDHEVEAEAEAMEQLERTALNRMGIADPYADASRQ